MLASWSRAGRTTPLPARCRAAPTPPTRWCCARRTAPLSARTRTGSWGWCPRRSTRAYAPASPRPARPVPPPPLWTPAWRVRAACPPPAPPPRVRKGRQNRRRIPIGRPTFISSACPWNHLQRRQKVSLRYHNSQTTLNSIGIIEDNHFCLFIITILYTVQYYYFAYMFCMTFHIYLKICHFLIPNFSDAWLSWVEEKERYLSYSCGSRSGGVPLKFFPDQI